MSAKKRRTPLTTDELSEGKRVAYVDWRVASERLGYYRRSIWKFAQVVRVTPKRTRVILDDGTVAQALSKYDRSHTDVELFEPDDGMAAENEAAELEKAAVKALTEVSKKDPRDIRDVDPKTAKAVMKAAKVILGAYESLRR